MAIATVQQVIQVHTHHGYRYCTRCGTSSYIGTTTMSSCITCNPCANAMTITHTSAMLNTLMKTIITVVGVATSNMTVHIGISRIANNVILILYVNIQVTIGLTQSTRTQYIVVIAQQYYRHNLQRVTARCVLSKIVVHLVLRYRHGRI